MASKEETLKAFSYCMGGGVVCCDECPYKRYVNCRDKLRDDVRRALGEDAKPVTNPVTNPATYNNMFDHAINAYHEMKHKYPERVIMNRACYEMLLSEVAEHVPEGFATYNGIRVMVIKTLVNDPFFVFVDSWNKVMLTKM